MIIQTSMLECSDQQNLNLDPCILMVLYMEKIVLLPLASRVSRRSGLSRIPACSARASFRFRVMLPPQLRLAAAPALSVLHMFARPVLICVLGHLLVLLAAGSVAVAQSSTEDASRSSDATVPLAASEISSDSARMLPSYDELCAHRTGIQATMIVPADATLSVQGRPLAVGDQVAVFSADGVCAGFITWGGENAALTIWGDNYLTSEVDGLLGGDPMHIRIRRADRGIEHSSRNSHVTLIFRDDAAYLTSVPTFRPDGIYVVETLTIDPVEHANGAR